MTTERKRWLRLAAIAVGGIGVITGGWYSFLRATPAQEPEPTWTQSATPLPAVTEVHPSREAPPATAPVTPASATLPIPTAADPSPIAQSGPSTPPILIPAPPLPVPPSEPIAGPSSADKNKLPPVPVVPSIPHPELPPLPTPPKVPEVKPVLPTAEGTVLVPPLPIGTAEPPKVPAPPTPAPIAPVGPGMTSTKPADPAPPMGITLPGVPQPLDITPPVPPAKSADPAPPLPPVKSDSGLQPNNPGNTLNPTVPPLAPIVPPSPGGTVGRETPGTPVDRPKPPEPKFGSTDKYVFPVPIAPDTITPQHRDDTMLKTTTTLAVFGAALLAAEQAKAFPPLPAPPVIPMPGTQVRDDKTEIETLKTNLAAANQEIAALKKRVDKLTELLSGKRDDLGFPVPTEPGAIEDVKELKNKIAKLEAELKALKTQTSLKPAIGTPGVGTPAQALRGIVKVVNDYPVEITMLINEKSYRVAPNTKVEVDVPAGEFTYQLLQSGAPPTKSVIKDKETVTLRIK